MAAESEANGGHFREREYLLGYTISSGLKQNKTPQYHGTVTGLEVHLSALKQMLSIWDNPSITKVRHCAE